jgi:hypothetical protein
VVDVGGTGSIAGRTFTLQQLFGESRYDIDYYQREYAWSRDDVRTLIDDLTRLFEERERGEQCFLGPFVYHETRPGVRYLVDGQQRFTTLHLLFLHLRQRAVELDDQTSIHALDPLIRTRVVNRWRFRIDIDERRDALQALYELRVWEPPPGATLSLRNLWDRSKDIADFLDTHLQEFDDLEGFVDWLLNEVVLVGIEAPTRESGLRIFESMNDRGARLTSIDLVKSFLLTEARHGQEELNGRWRTMLATLTSTREDPTAPTAFLKSLLIAHHARAANSDDMTSINTSPHLWMRKHAHDLLKLRRPHDFTIFVERLTHLAAAHRMFLAASGKLDRANDLDPVFYNHYNGLPNQMVLVLAAIRPNDTLSMARDKGRLIAAFIDRWYVQRLIAEEPALTRDLDVVIAHLLLGLRSCNTVEDVRATLSAEDVDDDEFRGTLRYGIRSNNRRQVRYLLARLTAFVDRACGEPDRIDEFLADDRSWHLDHIFANHATRHSDVDPDTFRRLRDQLGLIVLLKASVNTSIQDQTLQQKLPVYASQNLLARSLHPDFRRNNKAVKTFLETHELGHHLRPISPREGLEAVAKLRQEACRRLMIAIWSRGSIGLTAPEPQPAEAQPARPRARGRRTDLEIMIDSGVLKAGSRVVGTARQGEVWATVEPEGGLRLDSGEWHRKPDDAGRAATGKRCAGMSFWHVQRSDGTRTPLRDLRPRPGTARRR